MHHLLLNEITSSQMLIRQSAIKDVQILINKLRSGEKLTIDKNPKLNISGLVSPDIEYSENPFDSFQENSVAIIPIIGTMYKYGYWYGMDDIANLIRLADRSDKIIGTILLGNTPGGTTHSLIQTEDALRNRIKPCVGLIDGQCCSAGAYTFSFCDRIAATNQMCEFGSIGVMQTLIKDDEYYKKFGIEFITIYPPESKYKNLEYREAINGDDKRLIEESLSPFAVHFQNIVKENRPGIDLSVEGILEGKVFYARDAIKYNLIDDILNLDEAIRLVQTLHTEKQSIYSQFK